ncbi:PTS galactitol transporter subunit IIC [Thermanaerothrix sp.]|jgi:PTS system galactitol-specific IIC component|uniref:PTS galactitol transporter subunit IIC n=1 Tax=Thermanaerothrix sp. TaxID=2972675 RepID=UPI002ADD7A0F|nr:PTS transporter subunit IIC [Thermanaerothrix sp.]
MQAALDAIRSFLDYGPNVALPVIMFLLCLVLGMRVGKAIGAGLMLGVAFTGIFVLFDFAFPILGKAGQAMVQRIPGLRFEAYDLGWTVASVISWAWPYAFLMFPLQITINIVMLALGWTKCLNVDMWNVWHKATLGAFVSALVGQSAPALALPLGFLVAAIWVVAELISADHTREQVYNLTRIPGIAVSHNMLLDIMWMAPVLDLIEKIPGLDKIKTSPADLRRRIGVFGENYVIGAILGLIFGLLAGYDFKGIATLIIQCAAIVTLFPLLAGLFARALAPVAEGAQEFMQKRFPGRSFYIGLDWPVLAGIDSLWVTGILIAPLILLFAIILPFNNTLPFGSIIAVSLVATVTVLTQGDLVKSLLLSIIGIPVYLGAATYFAPYLTNLAVATGAIQIPEGYGMVTWLETNAAGMRLLVFTILNTLNGQILPGLIALVILAFCVWYYFPAMKRRENAAAQESGGISGNPLPYPEVAPKTAKPAAAD